MFTGLIEEMGKVKNIGLSSDGMKLTIECFKILEDIHLGASICVNGACQSVIDFGENFISVQASNETLDKTMYKKMKLGDYVNLERALTLNKRIDGHLVSGHIDCTAEFLHKQNDGFSKKLFFKLPVNFSKYVISKGSITINGVSLTVVSIENNVFSVELIPITLNEVNLSYLHKSDFVNIEVDLFAKYIEKIVKSNKETKFDYKLLLENGFI